MKLTINYSDLLGAFALWERDYRKNPDVFDDCHCESLVDSAEESTAVLLKYLDMFGRGDWCCVDCLDDEYQNSLKSEQNTVCK